MRKVMAVLIAVVLTVFVLSGCTTTTIGSASISLGVDGLAVGRSEEALVDATRESGVPVGKYTDAVLAGNFEYLVGKIQKLELDLRVLRAELETRNALATEGTEGTEEGQPQEPRTAGTTN